MVRVCSNTDSSCSVKPTLLSQLPAARNSPAVENSTHETESEGGSVTSASFSGGGVTADEPDAVAAFRTPKNDMMWLSATVVKPSQWFGLKRYCRGQCTHELALASHGEGK